MYVNIKINTQHIILNANKISNVVKHLYGLFSLAGNSWDKTEKCIWFKEVAWRRTQRRNRSHSEFQKTSITQ